MEQTETPFIRFTVDFQKCIEGIQFLAMHKPAITQYYVSKVFFFADREHLKDWGRPISGDRYVAMNHGPVPSAILNLVKFDSSAPDEIIDAFAERVAFRHDGGKVHLYSIQSNPDFTSLSESDREYLLDSLNRHGHLSFGELRELSHEDPAYEEAWSKRGFNNEMDVRLWFRDNPAALAELYADGPIANRT